MMLFQLKRLVTAAGIDAEGGARQVDREVADATRAGRLAAVAGVVGVGVGAGVDVVARHHAVGVGQPAARRGDDVLGIDRQGAGIGGRQGRGVDRALDRTLVGREGVGGDPIEARRDLGGLGVDVDVVPVEIVRGANLEIPHQAGFAGTRREPGELGADLVLGEPRGVDAGGLAGVALSAEEARGALDLEAEMIGDGPGGGDRRDAGGRAARLAGEVGDESVVDRQDAAVTVDVDVQLAEVDRDAAMGLAQIEVGGAGDRGENLVGDLVVAQILGRQAEEIGVLTDKNKRQGFGVGARMGSRQLAGMAADVARRAGHGVVVDGEARRGVREGGLGGALGRARLSFERRHPVGSGVEIAILVLMGVRRLGKGPGRQEEGREGQGQGSGEGAMAGKMVPMNGRHLG